jgi:preprotein translocase subunit SecD
MMIRLLRFNTYLLVTVAAAAVAVCGCQSISEKKPRKLLSTLRLHVEASLDGTKANESVPVYREKPVWVNVEKMPFLTEANVSAASVIDGVGGFALSVQFDHGGTVLLEACTAANRGRKMAIFSQFGKEIKDYRWLAAPVINHRISNGVLVFTPDATREEAEEIALGLNNVSKKVHTWIDR